MASERLYFETYLREVEKELSPLPPSERIDALYSIKNQFTTLVVGGVSTAQAIVQMGSPKEVVAPFVSASKSKSSGVVWSALRFFGTAVVAIFLLFVLGIFSLVGDFSWKFPFYSLSSGMDSIEKMEKFFDDTDKQGWFYLNKKGFVINNHSGSSQVEGEVPIKESVKSVSLQFKQGAIELKNSDSNSVRWECGFGTEDQRQNRDLVLTEEQGVLNLNLNSIDEAKCQFYFPKRILVKIVGSAGVVLIESPQYPLDATLDAGTVQIETADEQDYDFDLKVDSGTVDPDLVSTPGAQSIPIKIRLHSGIITKENKRQ